MVDGPDGDDASLRPNQILAVSLGVLDGPRAMAVVDAVERSLLTPYGLRTLDPADPRYRPRYEGGIAERDAAYHMGTVWPWLLGPFVRAWLRVHGKDADTMVRARAMVKPLVDHLATAGLGHVSEIFDGDPPHTPRGCFAQAWSVAELAALLADELRAG